MYLVMSSEEYIGKITRFGCEYKVVKDKEKDSCYVKDNHGNEFKLTKSAAHADEVIIENARKLLKSAGL